MKGDNKIIASADDSDSAGITNAYNFAYGLTLLGGGSLDIKSADTHDTTYAIFIAKISSLIMSILLQLPAKPKLQEMKQFEVK